MQPIAWLALSTLGLAAGAALTRWVHRRPPPAVRLPDRLPPPESTPGSSPRIAVIVPARNEAANIGRCVESLLAQRYPDYEFIVVDDRSTDATPRILAELQRRAGPSLRVITGRPLPPGWAGKSHALAQGVAAASRKAEWLCFVDADTLAEPHLLAAAMAAARAHGADLFTILTRQRLGTFWEKVVMPLVFSALAVGFPPDRVNDPARPEAIANGQFILIRRAAYDAVGGHAALRHSITEDKDLAERVKGAGWRLLVADGRAAAETRMYTSLPELWQGWTKNIYLGLRGRAGLLLLGAATNAAGALLMPAWPAAGLAWLARGGGLPAAVVTAEALALWAYLLGHRARVGRELGLPARYALTLPLGALVFGGMMLASTARVLSGRGVEWKGRVYHAQRNNAE
jgi:chlorobactene glucosyltransferase